MSPHSIGTERVESHHNKLKSIQYASLFNETVNDRLITLLLSCRKRIAAIESHRLMYINRDISFENFLELTRVYNFSTILFVWCIYHVSEVLKYVHSGCVVYEYVILCTNNNS